jgi:hypothetical protein
MISGYYSKIFYGAKSYDMRMIPVFFLSKGEPGNHGNHNYDGIDLR